jgi:hypothetical protein
MSDTSSSDTRLILGILSVIYFSQSSGKCSTSDVLITAGANAFIVIPISAFS